MKLHDEIMNIKTNNCKVNDYESDYGSGYESGYAEGHRDARHAAAELAIKYDELLEVTIAMRDYIDALPKDLILPAMPGFDRDWADNVIADVKRGS